MLLVKLFLVQLRVPILDPIFQTWRMGKGRTWRKKEEGSNRVLTSFENITQFLQLELGPRRSGVDPTNRNPGGVSRAELRPPGCEKWPSMLPLYVGKADQ